MEFTSNTTKWAPPHQRYLVERNGKHFVATPCYGMHNPWWVPMSPTGETEPIDMERTDSWALIPRK